jgi:hypothetical protein
MISTGGGGGCNISQPGASGALSAASLWWLLVPGVVLVLLSIRNLLDSRVCYPADWSIAGAGLSPARKAAVLGCTVVPIRLRNESGDSWH